MEDASGPPPLWVGAGMTEHEEQGMKRDEWLSETTRVSGQNYNIYTPKSLRGNQLVEGTQILEKSSGQRNVG